MAEICGYDNESVAFWHKYGRLGEKMRLVSTDFEANLVFRNIPRDRVIEVYFKHLDSYIGMDISNNVEQNRKEGRAEYSSSDHNFEDSDNYLSDEHDILERGENGTREYEDSKEVRKKMAHDEDGDSDCVNSEGFKSLESDSNSDGMNFIVFNPNTDGLYPILALELIFKSKKGFKNLVITHEEGFKSGCRKIVGVDGCWLKCPMYGTQLLTVVGLDHNNNIYPIAYVVMEKVNRESWAWFLDHLKLDLEIDDGAHWTFMARFGGNTLRNALWKAASATTVRWFDERMVEIFDLDLEAANCMILDARNKPIITLLEKIRYMLMTKMQANRDKSSKWSSDDICPRIKNVFCKSQAAAAEYIPRKSNEWNYELIGTNITDIWAINLFNRKCSCRKWNLTCKHAIAAIWACFIRK
ncbi:hypothetical protein KY285_012039 [Solanum tuberosum]|nr:hypothetical protein KY285_012039 [Solanum tuberosum]